MVATTKGNFTLNLGIVKLGTDLSDDDRQCAWELYTELSSRIAVTGKQGDSDCTDFEGEIYTESLQSLYTFFQEARRIMRSFPVGRLKPTDTNEHLGILINRVMNYVLRPFLEKWQSRYRHWWENEADKTIPPMERQKAFPELNTLLQDWADARWLMCELQKTLIQEYKLVDVNTL